MSLLRNILKRINLIRYRCKSVFCDSTNSLSFRKVTIIGGGGGIPKKTGRNLGRLLLGSEKSN